MKKKKPLLKRLFAFAGNHKYFTVMGMILSGVSAIIAGADKIVLLKYINKIN